MGLPIKLNACVINNCSVFEISVFNNSNELLDLNNYDFSEATIIITNISSGEEKEFDILPIIEEGFEIGPNTSEIIINATLSNYEDGEYDIQINLVSDIDPSNNTSVKIKIFSYCSVRCCVDKMWAKYQGALGCGCKCNGEAYKNVMEAESLYMALKHASSCMNSEAVQEILKKLQRICSLEKCKCK